VHYYELHEGDAEVYSDVLLAHEEEWEPEEFFELVQTIRRRVQVGFDEDTLIEAIAAELEREQGFTFISDERLTASVNVSRDDDDNFLADIHAGDPEDADDDLDADFLTITADFDPEGNGGRPH
jgi:hypothetical protein